MDKVRILYIEDYPVVQQLYADVLKQHFEVDVASDGKEALDKIGNNDYDVILLDILLPDIGGLDFLKQYQAEYTDKKARMIVLSDFDNENTIKQLKALGVQEYWMKVDNTPHVLVEKINTLLHT